MWCSGELSKTAYIRKSKKDDFQGILIVQAIQKIQALVQIFDLRCVDYHVDVPEILKFEKLLPSVLNQHMPSATARISNVAFTVCYHVYLKNNPSATLEDYQTKFLTTAAGVTAYQEALNLVSTKIKEKITVEDIEGLYKKDPPSVTK